MFHCKKLLKTNNGTRVEHPGVWAIYVFFTKHLGPMINEFKGVHPLISIITYGKNNKILINRE